MKYFIVVIISFVFYSCQSTKTSVPVNPTSVFIKHGCPLNGDCTAEIEENKRISYQKEKTTGKFFPELKTDSTVNVIRITFDKRQDGSAVDAQYHEELFFEWPKSKTSIKLTDRKLQEIHFTYGRFCFCDEATVGYFKVDKGEFLLRNGEIMLTVQDIRHIPQSMQKLTLGYEQD